MSLRDCMEQHTHREYLAWMEWLDEEWKQPETTDFYLMQVAQEVARKFARNPRAIKLENFVLEFSEKQKEKPQPKTKAEAAAMSKSIWLARVDYKP